jgi:hypothetical protein
MVSEANQKQIEAAGLSFILGMKIPRTPYVVAQWQRDNPGEQIPDRHLFTQPRPAGPNAAAAPLRSYRRPVFLYRGRTCAIIPAQP